MERGPEKEATVALVTPVFVQAGPAPGCAQFPSVHIHWVSTLGQALCGALKRSQGKSDLTLLLESSHPIGASGCTISHQRGAV